MRKAIVIPVILIVIFLVFALVGSFMLYFAPRISKEFQKDLAEVRGYWAAYGAKELNASISSYKYYSFGGKEIYTVIVYKSADLEKYNYNWQLINDNKSGIKNSDIYRRVLTVDSNDRILSYIGN